MFQKKLNKSVPGRRYLCEHSKILYKVHEVFCICRDAFFEKDIEKEPGNFMGECSKCGERYHRKCEVITKKIYSLNQMLLGDVAFPFHKCLLLTHFLFPKS